MLATFPIHFMTHVFSREALAATLAIGALMLPLALQAEDTAADSTDACTTLACIREKRKALHETGKTEKKAIRETAKTNPRERRAKFVECIKAAATSEEVDAVVTAAKACIEALRSERLEDRGMMKDKRMELRARMRAGRTGLKEEHKDIRTTRRTDRFSRPKSSASSNAAVSSAATSTQASSAAASSEASSAASAAQ